MRICPLRHRAELQTKAVTADAGGGLDVDAWIPERTIWCGIKPISVVQRLENMRRDSIVTHEIKARYADDIDTTKRIVYKERAFNIEGVLNADERNRELTLLASEGVAT